jgi:acyl-CoA synthetase (NDP forming)
VFRTVDYLLRPKSIAIVGASDSSRGGWAQSIYDNLEAGEAREDRLM